MGGSRTCLVSFTDPEGSKHSVQVDAASLYEAAGLGLAAFKREGWSQFGPASRLQVEVRQPSITHEVSVKRTLEWLGGSLSPAERLMKLRLKALIEGEEETSRPES